MASSSRDRISVDLRGLKAALFERARVAGVTPSGFVRDALVASLGGERASSPLLQPASTGRTSVRLSLRVTRDQAAAIVDAARAAGMPLGTFLFGLVTGVPSLAAGVSPRDLLAALTATNAELASLARNLNHLGLLLRQGAWRAADEYRPTLATLSCDVRAHLELATRTLAALQPARQVSVPFHQPA